MGKGSGSCSGRPGLTFGGAAIAEAPTSVSVAVDDASIAIERHCHMPNGRYERWWDADLEDLCELFPDVDPSVVEAVVDGQVQAGCLIKYETVRYDASGPTREVSYTRTDEGDNYAAKLFWESLDPFEQTIVYSSSVGAPHTAKGVAMQHGVTTAEAKLVCDGLVERGAIQTVQKSGQPLRYGKSWSTASVLNGDKDFPPPVAAPTPPVGIVLDHAAQPSDELKARLIANATLLHDTYVHDEDLAALECTEAELATALRELADAGQLTWSESLTVSPGDNGEYEIEHYRSYGLTDATRAVAFEAKIESYPYLTQDVLHYYAGATQKLVQHNEIRAKMGMPAGELTQALAFLVDERVLRKDSRRMGYGKYASSRSGWVLTSFGQKLVAHLQASA
jgi:hypothetical protein